MVLDSHRWVPLPSVGFTTNGVIDESQDDATPPSVLMEHPPIAVFVNGKYLTNAFYSIIYSIYLPFGDKGWESA